MSNVETYLHELVGNIGARPVASDTERTAAEWIASTFFALGLPAEIQDFETNRTTTWSNFLYYLVAVLCVLIIGAAGAAWLRWLFFIVFVLDVIGFELELRGGRVLSRILSKGPSQNVIARYSPRMRPGESRRKKVVLVAHYDTLRTSPLTENNLAAVYGTLSRIARWYFLIAPLLMFLIILPIGFLAKADRWVWYLALVASIVPLVLCIDLLIRGVFKRFSPGANNNASGVAALLEAARGLTEGFTDLDENMKQHTQSIPVARNDFFANDDEGRSGLTGEIPSAAPASATGAFTAVDAPAGDADDAFPDDFAWASPASAQKLSQAGDFSNLADDSARSAQPTMRAAKDNESLQFETTDFGVVPDEAVAQPTVSFAPVESPRVGYQDTFADAPGVLGPDIVGDASPVGDYGAFEHKSSFFDRLKGTVRRSKGKGKRKRGRSRRDPDFSTDSADWLGLSEDFDSHSAGEQIGSWDNYNNDGFEDDGFGWKGGAASGDLLEDPDFASDFAARLRRKANEGFDIPLDVRDLWFVALGASGVHGAGMGALLDTYGSELRDALFINIECIGDGTLSWYTEEGLGTPRQASARLANLARRTARSQEIPAKGVSGAGRATDAYVALKRGFRALTVTRLLRSGMPANWRDVHDELRDVDPAAIEETVALLLGMVREV